MKSNDVIAIKEGVISDIGNKMFGGGKKADKKGNSNRQAAPQIGDGGTTSTKRLAKKLFVQDFVADVVSSLQAGINSGLILPPKAHHADKTLDESYNKLDTVLENIIKEAPLEVNSNYGRTLSDFIKDWLGQWMVGVEYSNSKPALYSLIDSIENTYNQSAPGKPNISRPMLAQLADGAWAASASSGMPKGAKNAAGAGQIAAGLNPQAAEKGQQAEYTPTPKYDFVVKTGAELGSPTSGDNKPDSLWRYDGKTWIHSSPNNPQVGNRNATDAEIETLMNYVKQNPEYQAGVGQEELKLSGGSNVAESKTKSALRAEKLTELAKR